MFHLVLHHLVSMLVMAVAAIAGLTIPPAAKVLGVVALVYPIVQALKKAPLLAPYIKGWVAIALNVLLSAGGLLIEVPADQLYTTNTLIALIQIVLAAAGVHGTVSALSASQPCPNCGHPPDQPVTPAPVNSDPAA